MTWVHRIKILSMDSVPILLLVGLRRETLVKHVVVGSVQLDLRPAIGAGGMPIILSDESCYELGMADDCSCCYDGDCMGGITYSLQGPSSFDSCPSD